jgi:hypothetical protein
VRLWGAKNPRKTAKKMFFLKNILGKEATRELFKGVKHATSNTGW